MTITNTSQMLDALANNSSRVVWDKASLPSAAAGQIFSLWRATGVPGQGAIPTTAAVCTSALVGSIGFANQTAPVTSYYGWQTVATSNATSSIEIHDRLAHMGGLSGIVATAQGALTLTGLSAARLGDTNYSDVQWWLEWYTDTGATAVSATVAVTYNDDTTGNIVVALAATTRAGRMMPVVSAVAGKFIKQINSVTLSATTGTAGNFGITATRPRTAVYTFVANKYETFDWAQLGSPEVPNGACLALIMLCNTTTTGTVRGQGKIAHG